MGGMYSRLRNIWKVTAEKKTDDALRIGILGAAAIAPFALIYPVGKLENAVVYGVAARNKAKAEKFAKKYKITKVFDSYEEIINSDEIDAIYNPLPNGYHALYTIMALKAGKHVLCEKPLASNAEEVEAIMEALKDVPNNARTNTKPIMIEAFHYRFHPFARKIKSMIEAGEFGEIKSVKTSFGLPWFSFGTKDIRYNFHGKNPELAGGSLMDAGCYAISMARLVADSANGELSDFEVTKATIRETFAKIKGVDCSANASLVFKSGENVINAEVSASFRSWGFGANCSIVGTKKTAYVYNFLAPFAYHYMTVRDLETNRSNTIKEYGHGGSTYEYQVYNFVNAVLGDEECIKVCDYAGSIDNSLRNMEVIDAVYRKAGAEPRKGLDLSEVKAKN